MARVTQDPQTSDQVAYGMEALIVELATDPWLQSLKLETLKPETIGLLAGMLLSYASRARALHQDILRAVTAAQKAEGGTKRKGMSHARDSGRPGQG